jgi:hypothetical protein
VLEFRRLSFDNNLYLLATLIASNLGSSESATREIRWSALADIRRENRHCAGVQSRLARCPHNNGERYEEQLAPLHPDIGFLCCRTSFASTSTDYASTSATSYHRWFRASGTNFRPHCISAWLVSVSRGPSPTALEATHQQAQIDKVGVRDADRKTLISTLTTFNIQYQNLIKSFNTEAKAAWATGESPDTAAFLLQRDQIVQSTIDELKTHLGGSGWANLTAHVNREKAHMRINMEVAQ